MRTLKPVIKKSGKHDRERKVLLGLIEYFLKTGKPVGSNTLKDVGFADLSSATIRNYFAHLEESGYLLQQHSSGGRIPTDKAFRLYASEYHNEISTAPPQEQIEFNQLRNSETREIASFLQNAAEKLAEMTNGAVFLSAPHFEQDFIIAIKVIAIDSTRCLCVLVTDFGQILTEILYTPTKLSSFAIKRLESYFHWRLTGHDKPEGLDKEEETLAQSFYNELLVRYIVDYNHFIDEEIYRTGFSKLLAYPEFHDSATLANSLALFENTHGMRLLLKECSKHDRLLFWIGDDLITYSPHAKPNCAVLAVPFHVNKQTVGAVGLLGPMRMPYRTLFSTLRGFAESVSEALTRNLYKFKISMKQPKAGSLIKQEELRLIGQSKHLLLENKNIS